MRTIIAGSRRLVRYSDVARAIRESGWEDCISVVISGGAIGADLHGERWADTRGRIVERFPVTESEWRRYGKAAGPMRNRRMAAAADACIVVWDGASPGSRNMIFEAQKAGLPLFIERMPTEEPNE